jgi:HAD superfamily hydrolase (TIGR01490 family)
VTINNTPVKIAVFDVDRTLLKNTSGEAQLIRFLRKQKKFPLFNFVRAVIFMLRHMRKGLWEAVFRNKAYLYGLNVDEIKELLPDFFEKCLKPRLSILVRDYMDRLKKMEYEIILISGTLDVIIQHLVKEIGAHGGRGAILEERDGRFTGKIVGTHPYRGGKIHVLQEYLKGRDVDYEQSFGFADAWADVPLLSIFGNPVAVNPGCFLRRSANCRGWPILFDKSKVYEDSAILNM